MKALLKEAMPKDAEPIDVICPGCGREILVYDEYICPKCGCEFEPAEKQYRLTKFGAIVAGVSAFFFAAVFTLLFYTAGGSSDAEELVKVNFTSIFLNPDFLRMLAFSASTLLFSVLVVVCSGRADKLLFSLFIITLGIVSLRFLSGVDKQTMFCPVAWILIVLPISQISGGIFCFIDQFLDTANEPD